MAAFREHITFSSVIGVGYAGACWHAGVPWPHATLAGILCGFSGMLPDLDSDSGRPIKELFGLTAALVPMIVLRKLRPLDMDPDIVILIAIGTYFFIRYAVSWALATLTVHRGMFHSIPAALIAAELAFLADSSRDLSGRLLLASGVLLGFLSHLVLDEIYSVDFKGMRLKSSAGTAIKLFSGSLPASLFTWVLFGGLTYLACVDQGVITPLQVAFAPTGATQ